MFNEFGLFLENGDLLELIQLEGLFSKNKDDEKMKQIAEMPMNSLVSYIPDFIKNEYNLSEYRKLTSAELYVVDTLVKSLQLDSKVIYKKDILGTRVVIIEKIGETAKYLKDPKMIYIYYANKYDSTNGNIPKSHILSFSSLIKYICANS